MILENKKIKEQEIKKYSLSDLLEIKKEKFFSNDFYNYSYDEKKAFVEDNKIDAIEIAEIYTLLAGLFIFGLGLGMFFLIPSFIPSFVIPLIAGGAGVMGFGLTSTFKKIVIRIWLSKEKDNDILKLAMFLASVVTEDILKAFIEEYGQDDLVSLLYQKECLTYKDLYDYINREIPDEKIDIKKQKLEEAVKCLAEK